MKRVGIGGFMLADVNAGGARPSRTRLPSARRSGSTPVRHAAAEADRLGLEMAVFSSPGWSVDGGPWVKPNEAMKKIVWSETTIVGPRKFRGKLPDPPRNNGQIRNVGAPYDPKGGGDPTTTATAPSLRIGRPSARWTPPPQVRSSRPVTVPWTARRCWTIS